MAASCALRVCEFCTFGKGAVLGGPEAVRTAAGASAPTEVTTKMVSAYAIEPSALQPFHAASAPKTCARFEEPR